MILLILFSLCAPAGAFQEVWAYLYKGEERYFPAPSPITDIGCFSAKVEADGTLSGGHTAPPDLPGTGPRTRYHLVITIPWNKTLAQIYLDPTLPLRNRIIRSIVERSGPFDGIQIDFESIASDNKDDYLNFIWAVRKALPKNKIYSVAVLPRWGIKESDPFDYPVIARATDRIVVMAYDEHYSSAPPGPIASFDWCKKIYKHALSTIPAEKLIMGIPLYGRAWQDKKLARAYKHRDLLAELRRKNIQPVQDPKNGNAYTFEETVTVNVHYESKASIITKLNLYSQHPIRGVAFWRIGQEPPALWRTLTGQFK